jgi:hypothetical protein
MGLNSYNSALSFTYYLIVRTLDTHFYTVVVSLPLRIDSLQLFQCLYAM